MNRKAKVLGLALGAMFAMSAFVATGAQAETHEPLHLTPSEYPAIITGVEKTDGEHPKHVFKPEIGSISCEEVRFGGTVADADSNTTLTIHPIYGGCAQNAPGGTFPVTVFMTHCDYLFTEGTEAETHKFTNGQVSLVCPNMGEAVHVKVYTSGTHATIRCEYTVTPFVHKGNNTATNVTGGTDDVVVTSKVEGIVIHRTVGSFFNCGLAEQNATYTGETTMTAYEDKGVHVTEDQSTTETTYTFTEGSQLGLTVSK